MPPRHRCHAHMHTCINAGALLPSRCTAGTLLLVATLPLWTVLLSMTSWSAWWRQPTGAPPWPGWEHSPSWRSVTCTALLCLETLPLISLSSGCTDPEKHWCWTAVPNIIGGRPRLSWTRDCLYSVNAHTALLVWESLCHGAYASLSNLSRLGIFTNEWMQYSRLLILGKL